MNTVTLYSRSFCSWCLRAKWLLRRRGIPYEEIDASAADVRQRLLARTGRHTVPQIFVGDVHVGGYEDLRALDARGGLDALLGRP